MAETEEHGRHHPAAGKETNAIHDKQAAEPRFVQEVDAEGNVIVQATLGTYADQYLKVPEAVGTAAIADKWAREPNIPPLDHAEVPADPLTPEETATALAAADAAGAHLRGEEGAPVYPLPPDPPPEGGEGEGGARRKAAAADDDDDRHSSRKRR